MKILCWNINQRSNANNKNEIPSFIINTLLIREPIADIIILTEFAQEGIQNFDEFMSQLKNSSYNAYVTKNHKNNILIAINEKYSVTETFTWNSSYDSYLPDYLDVTFSLGGTLITVIGARILVGKYKYPEEADEEMQKRYMQSQNIINRISLLKERGNLIIGGGDFNTGRRENKNIYWKKEILLGELQPFMVNLITPDGWSHEMHKKEEYRGCPDHIFASKIFTVSAEPYDWKFGDNKEYNEYKDKDGSWYKAIDSPYPDHGIIVADVKIDL